MSHDYKRRRVLFEAYYYDTIKASLEAPFTSRSNLIHMDRHPCHLSELLVTFLEDESVKRFQTQGKCTHQLAESVIGLLKKTLTFAFLEMRFNRGIKELIKGFSQKQRMMARASRKGIQSALVQTGVFKKEMGQVLV